MIRLTGEAETEAFGRALADRLRPGDAVALFGELGAGKTSLSRGVLRGLGFEGDAPSPTFPIAVAYAPPEVRMPVWHVDLYRIESPLEIEELALDEALGEAALLIEWPDRMGAGLWPHALRLRLSVEGDGVRGLTAQVPASWEARWPVT